MDDDLCVCVCVCVCKCCVCVCVCASVVCVCVCVCKCCVCVCVYVPVGGNNRTLAEEIARNHGVTLKSCEDLIFPHYAMTLC